jgi:hypothetical protein
MITGRLAARGATLALVCVLAGCDEAEPIQLGPCAAPAGVMTELAPMTGGVSSLIPSGDGVLFLERRGADPLQWKQVIRRVGRDGTGVDLGEVEWEPRAELLATGNEVFWSSLGRGPVVRRVEIRAMPLAGGPIRLVGVVRLDWQDDSNSLVTAATPFAADDRMVYLRLYRQGAGTVEERIYAMSRADGGLSLLATLNDSMGNAQLVGGYVWWTPQLDGRRVFRIPTTGPPTVETFSVADCRYLRATEEGDFYCGDVARLVHHDRNANHRRVLIEGDDRSDFDIFALEAGWLWLYDRYTGSVRKLHLPSERLEDVACQKVKTRPVLTSADLVWADPIGTSTLDPSVVLQRQAR